MRLRRLFPPTAEDVQGVPERVFAPQRGLASIGPVLRGRCRSFAGGSTAAAHLKGRRDRRHGLRLEDERHRAA
jgi:hypothetical protein